MSAVGLIFACENGRSTPRLRAMPDTANTWNEEELRELESELNKQYSDILRGKVETLTFQSRQLRVEVQNNGRAPTLLLTDASRPVAFTALVNKTAWLEGLLAELASVSSAHTDANVPPLDAAMLQHVAEELRQMSGRAGSDEVAALLLIGYLSAAERLFRPSDSDRATIYSMAHRALEKLLEHKGVGEQGWGHTRGGKPANGAAPVGAFGRLIRKLLGGASSANGV